MGQKEQHAEILRQVEGLELCPVAAPELGPVGEEERDVRPDAGRHGMQLGRRERLRELRIREPKGRRGVGASPTEPRCDRNVLPQLDAPAVRRPERDQGRLDDRVAGKPVERRGRSRLDRDTVAEVEPLVDGDEFVLPVGAERTDDEREVQLGRSRADQRSASASAGNSAGASASARTFGSRPIAARAATACSREVTPASPSELASVFRR